MSPDGPRGPQPTSSEAADSASGNVPSIDEFLGDPTRDLEKWLWLWQGDHEFPVRSHRRFGGPLVVWFKRLLSPLVRAPQQELWDRQRFANIAVLEGIRQLHALQQRDQKRLEYLEAVTLQGLQDLMNHNDALYARVDLKLDRFRHETRQLWAQLGAALARVAPDEKPVVSAGSAVFTAISPEAVRAAHEEIDYVEFERRFRGTEEEIAARLERYVSVLAGTGDVLDLGCGRGEALALFARHGLAVRGVDSSAQMVEACRARGVDAVQGDLVEVLAGLAPSSTGAIVSFHVIEHLPPPTLDRLVRLAWRALRPGGKLILETPNALSMVVAARNFWLDPTHLRPVHPDALRSLFERAGFDPVESLELQPFPEAARLPEIDLTSVPTESREVADQVNRLRDRLDDLLYGAQDMALVGTKPVGQ